MQAAASCILPKEVNGVLYGGREGNGCVLVPLAVKGPRDLLTTFSFVDTENSLLLDLDSKFDALRLIQVHAV